MITMFVMLSLENMPDNLAMGQELSNWTLLFFISYVLLASFLIFNLFIGIVINSMEEARAIELHKAERELDEDETDDADAHPIVLNDRMRVLRESIEASSASSRAAPANGSARGRTWRRAATPVIRIV